MTLTSAEIADLRTHAAEILIDTCNILEVTRTKDAYGGWVDSWGTATASVSCRLVPATQQGILSMLGEQPDRVSFYTWTVAYDQTVSLENRVEINSETYEIKLPIEETGTIRSVKRFVVMKS